MLIVGRGNWEKHRTWAVVTLLAWLAGFSVYLHDPESLRGRSVLGLSSGIGAAVIIAVECCYVLRRRSSWDRASLTGWTRWCCVPLRSLFDRQPTRVRLRQHIWLGLVSVPLVYIHSGSRWGGAIPTTLSVLFLATVLSGVLGLFLQQWLPRLLRLEIPDEAIYSQIPETLTGLLHESELLVRATCGPLTLSPQPVPGGAARRPSPFESLRAHRRGRGTNLLEHVPAEPIPGSGPLLEFYEARVRPFLAASPSTSYLRAIGQSTVRVLRPFDDRVVLSSAGPARAEFWRLRGQLAPAVHQVVDALEGACDLRRQLVHQARLHVLLHHWLLIHLPTAMALPILLAMHVFTAWKFQ